MYDTSIPYVNLCHVYTYNIHIYVYARGAASYLGCIEMTVLIARYRETVRTCMLSGLESEGLFECCCMLGPRVLRIPQCV